MLSTQMLDNELVWRNSNYIPYLQVLVPRNSTQDRIKCNCGVSFLLCFYFDFVAVIGEAEQLQERLTDAS